MPSGGGTEVALLWEAGDPDEVLARRFGFVDAGSAVAWVTEALADMWTIDVRACDRLVMSAGNLMAWITTDTARLIAKWSSVPRLFPRLEATAALTAWLDERGLPVAAPIPSASGSLRVTRQTRSLGVQPVVDGDLLDPSGADQAAQAGRLLAALHEALAVYPHRLRGRLPIPGRQLVHNDYRSANLLHDGEGISAVLDFEEVKYGTPVADLAKATALLGTRYHDWGPTPKEAQEVFLTAYTSMTPLRRGEERALRRSIAAVEGHFGWKRPS